MGLCRPEWRPLTRKVECAAECMYGKVAPSRRSLNALEARQVRTVQVRREGKAGVVVAAECLRNVGQR